MTGEKRHKIFTDKRDLCLFFKKQMPCALSEKCQKFRLNLRCRWLTLRLVFVRGQGHKVRQVIK